MTEPLPFAMLSPLGLELTSLLQPREKSANKVTEVETKKGHSATGRMSKKRRHMMTVMRAVHDTPPPVAQNRTAPSIIDETTKAPQEAKSSGAPLGTTLSEIDTIIADVVPDREIDVVVAAETLT
jgi:hypothetical protein